MVFLWYHLLRANRSASATVFVQGEAIHIHNLNTVTLVYGYIESKPTPDTRYTV